VALTRILQSAVFGYGGGEGLRRTIAGAVSGVVAVAAVASHEHAYARSGLGNGPDWRRGWGVASGGAGRLVRVAYGDIIMLTGNLTLTG
jgi:hypothetical protein